MRSLVGIWLGPILANSPYLQEAILFANTLVNENNTFLRLVLQNLVEELRLEDPYTASVFNSLLSDVGGAIYTSPDDVSALVESPYKSAYVHEQAILTHLNANRPHHARDALYAYIEQDPESAELFVEGDVESFKLTTTAYYGHLAYGYALTRQPTRAIELMREYPNICLCMRIRALAQLHLIFKGPATF